MKPRGTAALAAGLIVFWSSTSSQALTYRASFLAPDGTANTFAYGTSETGQVGNNGRRALYWSNAGGNVVDLHPIGFDITNARGIYGNQQVGSGYGPLTGGRPHALLWSGTAESVVDLTPPGFDSTGAHGIFGTNQVGTGSGPATALETHALMWSGTPESAVDLHPDGYEYSAALGVTASSQVGTGSPVGASSYQALLWRGSAESVVNLNPDGYVLSIAFGASDTTQVGYGVGAATGNDSHALLWFGSAESVVDLNPSGFTDSQAWDALADVQVGFGAGVATSELNHALLWHGSASDFVDLHPFASKLGPSIVESYAYGIGSDGVITGYVRVGHPGYLANSRYLAVKWTPIPEPSSCALFASGLFAVAFVNRRAHRKLPPRGR